MLVGHEHVRLACTDRNAGRLTRVQGQEPELFPQYTSHLKSQLPNPNSVLASECSCHPHSSCSRHKTRFECPHGDCGLATHINVDDRTLWMKKRNFH